MLSFVFKGERLGGGGKYLNMLVGGLPDSGKMSKKLLIIVVLSWKGN